jgi:predicted RNA binding protein YcfA (HicA-like mRNA interferase family)
MPKLPRVRATEVIRVLEKLGFRTVRQKGSHVIMKKTVVVTEDGNLETIEIGCVVPMHSKDIAIGTLANILRQGNVSAAEFLENL